MFFIFKTRTRSSSLPRSLTPINEIEMMIPIITREEEYHDEESIKKHHQTNSDLDWRYFLIVIPPLSLFIFLYISSVTAINTTNTFSSLAPLKSFFPINSSSTRVFSGESMKSSEVKRRRRRKEELNESRIAVCLVGGARRFELTGPSIVQKILKEYPNSDLYLHGPLDANAFKFSLLKSAPKIASIRIFQPKPITETGARVLTASGSPYGIQGLLQYFNLVEGCLTLINLYQAKHNFTYDWIVRTRVDSYWSAPLDPECFVPEQYLVPLGSEYGGLNDRFGVGDLNASIVALSRLSLIPKLGSAGFHQLNSERAFKAQLTTQRVPYFTKKIPFCIVTDHKYAFSLPRFDVLVAAMSSPGPLSGEKCRPCKPVCEGRCVEGVMQSLQKGWNWSDWGNGTLQLCDARGDWERGWEKIFDQVAGEKLAAARKRIWELKMKECVNDFDGMRQRAGYWDAPPSEDICRLGLESVSRN